MKISIKSILSLMLIFGLLTAQSQFATVRGIVYEKETGEPSFGTNVKIKGTGTGSSTDLNGYYQISKLPGGKITLEITNIEFKTVEYSIELKKGKITTHNFFMEFNDEVLDEFEYSAEAEERKKI